MSTQWQTWVVCTSPQYGTLTWWMARQLKIKLEPYIGIWIMDTHDHFY